MIVEINNDEYYSSGTSDIYNPLIIERIKLKGMQPKEFHFLHISINNDDARFGILFKYDRLDDGGYSIFIESALMAYSDSFDLFNDLIEPLVNNAGGKVN